MRHWLLLLFLTAALFSAFPNHAHAAATEWQRAEGVSVRLLSGVNGTGNETQIPLALEIQLDNNWHTYWRSPGEAGLPPQFDWRNSLTEEGNLQGARLLYPAPHRYTAFGLETIGYRDTVTLPVDAQLRTPGKPVTLDGTLNLLVCSNICVPRSFTLHLLVPATEATPSPEGAQIAAAHATVPQDAQKSGVNIAAVSRNTDNIAIALTSDRDFTEPDAFIENDKQVYFAKAEISKESDKPSATVIFKLSDPLPEGITLADLPFTLTFVDNNNHAFEQTFDPANPEAVGQITPSPNPSVTVAPLPTPDPPSLWKIMLLAVIGGFILNLMPCVLPVLSLKILNVISHGGGSVRRVRRSFLMTAAGILFSFLILALFTIALKETGHVIGWGTQFQQPVFLVLLILLLTIFAANLWEQFEIPLPRFIIDRIDPHYHPKLAGDFATGAFATLLATPCTAPYLGTAVGFALASGPREILVTFMALGYGMILPYLAIAIWPRLATRLPKPGIWMIYLRRFFGLALAATAIYLLWVLTAEISLTGVGAVSISMLALLLLLSIRRRRRLRKAFPWLLAFVALIPFVVAYGSVTPITKQVNEGAWLAFDEPSISRYVGAGKTVFVDVTADWCLTCKANKKFTLASEEVTARLFTDPNVIAMQADWTNPDPVIAKFLKANGRYGIPFNIIFGPAAPSGLILPELLSPSLVLDGLNKAAGKT